MSYKLNGWDIIGWVTSLFTFLIGLVNTFWGNDPFFGIFVILLSFVFIPPLSTILKNFTGFSIPVLVKVLVFLFIMWASLGVGELFDKIDLMIMDLNQ